MDIIKATDGHRVTLSVVGTIDTETAPALNDALLALDYNGLDLTLDFSNTRYITSAGLRALLIARKKLSEDTMRILHANENILEVFSASGFDSFISIHGKEEDREQYRLSYSVLLRRRLESDGEKTAYVYRDRRYSWEDVEKISQLMAHDLAGQGVKKGTHVGICGPNSLNWVASFYAVQKLGGVAVLVNPGLRPHEVALMAQIGDITHLCFGEQPGVADFDTYSAACLGDRIRYMYDISDRVDFTERYGEYPAIAEKYGEKFQGDDPSVIIFSSGTTGLPKAILSSAYDMMISIEPLITLWHVGREDVNLAFLPLFHIFGFATGVSLGVLTGYTSVIPEHRYPALIIDLIERYRCTMFNSVPTMMLAITQTPGFTPERLSSLRASILGGSSTTESQMQMLRQLLPHNHFGNIYGMSENAAVSLTLYEDSTEHITKTVGKPVPGLELIIRDVNTGEALGVGQEGEICIRSQAMVVCYYRLAIEKQPVDEEGWLATGDLGVMDEEGYLHIVGRKKDLIICGGENISPGEIAEEIMRLSEVADVKVLGVPHPLKGEVVAAAVILKADAVWDEQQVRDTLAKRLAKYKLPVHYVVLDSFPLLGSGKVDAITLKKQVIEAVEK